MLHMVQVLMWWCFVLCPDIPAERHCCAPCRAQDDNVGQHGSHLSKITESGGTMHVWMFKPVVASGIRVGGVTKKPRHFSRKLLDSLLAACKRKYLGQLRSWRPTSQWLACSSAFEGQVFVRSGSGLRARGFQQSRVACWDQYWKRVF